MNFEENPEHFPAAVRAEDKRFFVRFSSGMNFLKIIKSVTLPSSNIILFITGDNQIQLVSEDQTFVQGTKA